MYSSLVLARKYRPRSFSEMVGQDAVVRALTNALATQRLHHAYLFTGTRGVGKTTVSRILAKSLNCVGTDGQGGITPTPCGVCEACSAIDAGRFVDYTELDAASNRGVDEVQALLEQAVYKPVVGRFKVFMIDEVHMLTNTAFNAMLKTLEEPPEYLKFVLATTDPQKIPVTVLSRCLQFNLRPMAPETVQEHLQKVLAQEGVAAEEGALKLLARGARGSMRDALSLTDQAIAFSHGGLTQSAVREMLGAVDASFVLDLIAALAAGQGQRVVQIVDGLRSQGLSAAFTLEDMARVLQKMAVYQALPAVDASQLDEEERRIAQLATALPPDETQLLYSLAIHGRAELGLAPDEYAGLTMTLLRLLAFKPPGFRPQEAHPQASQASPASQANDGTSGETAEPAEKKSPEPAREESPPRVETANPASNTIKKEAAQAGFSAQTAKNIPEKPEEQAAITKAAENATNFAASQAGFSPKTEGNTTKIIEAAPPKALVNLPVREMSAPAAVPTDGGQGDPAAQAAWLAVVDQLQATGQLQALQRELAVQSECVAAGEGWRTLRVEQSALRADAAREKLQTLLEQNGNPCLLRVELGTVSDSWARRQQAALAAQQSQAQASFMALPLVQHLLQDWGGKVVEGSVKALP